MVRRIGLSERFVTKAAVTILFHRRFYRALTLYRLEDRRKPTNISTVSFDCDHTADIEVLPRLLETLDSYQVKASFACIGAYIERYPREHRQILDRGHEIVNHTYSHPYHDELCPKWRFDTLSDQERRNEILRCHAVCEKILDYRPIGFRTPHFARQSSKGVHKILRELGYHYSSSTLAVSSPTFGDPYSIEGILEFPVSVCPRHPLQALDSHHAFESGLTSHTRQDYEAIFSDLVSQCCEDGVYLNAYFDPQHMVDSLILDSILDGVKKNTRTECYGTIVRDNLIDAREYSEKQLYPSEGCLNELENVPLGRENNNLNRSSRPLRVCLVCAPGGHLVELMRIKEAFKGCDLSLVTYKEGFQSTQNGIDKISTLQNLYIDRMNSGTLASALILARQMLMLGKDAVFILANHKPDVVLSTGSEIAIPFMYLAKLMGKRTVFIESLCRIDGLSATAKIVSPAADIMLVQWKNLDGIGRRTRFEGSILGAPKVSGGSRESEDFIFVTVGTAPFPRLVEMMDRYAGDSNRRVVIQLARTRYAPKHAEHFTFVERDEHEAYLKNAKIIVTHGGVGTILTALDYGKPMIIVPRLKEFNEGLDDNQLEIAGKMEGEPNVRVVRDIEMIPMALNDLEEKPSKDLTYSWEDSRRCLIGFVKDYLGSVKSEILQ